MFNFSSHFALSESSRGREALAMRRIYSPFWGMAVYVELLLDMKEEKQVTLSLKLNIHVSAGI
jgi:hypothetical protein